MRLLFVCTGNLCRSQLAEGLTAAWVASHQPLDAGRIELLSAGTRAPVGEQMDLASAAALTRRGGDPSGRRAKRLSSELLADADLVLTMTRGHRRAVLELAPRALRRTFTLLEAAHLLESADVHGLARLPLDQRTRELAARLDARRAHRASSEDDDVEDPIGRSPEVHERVADAIARALGPLLAALLPPVAHGETGPGAGHSALGDVDGPAPPANWSS